MGGGGAENMIQNQTSPGFRFSEDGISGNHISINNAFVNSILKYMYLNH